MIAMPSASGNIPIPVVNRILGLQTVEGYSLLYCFIGRGLIDKSRNSFVKKAIESDFDYIFFWDDDQIPDKDILIKYIELDKDIVGCPIPNRLGKKELAVFDEEYNKLNFIANTDGGSAMRVGAIGMANTLVKRKVFKSIAEKYDFPFEFEKHELRGERREFSEDVNFCKRANELGFEVWCHNGVKSLHMGEPRAFWYENAEYHVK